MLGTYVVLLVASGMNQFQQPPRSWRVPSTSAGMLAA
jgi:hypothetical protein